MNLEGNKSTKTEFKKHVFVENEEGMVKKQPAEESIEIRGILLPLKEEAYIAMYGSAIKSMYKYLIKPDFEVNQGDYFLLNNKLYEVETNPVKWTKYQTVILKVR